MIFIIGLAATIIISRRLLNYIKQSSKLATRPSGERAVAEELNRLMLDGAAWFFMIFRCMERLTSTT